jgi:hypothetical protein
MQVDIESKSNVVRSGGLRPFVLTDIGPVANLIWRVLHGHQEPAPPSLCTHLHDLFFNNPWLDDGIVSRVFENSDGKIIGFFGALPRIMSLQGRQIRLAFGSNFVVDPGSRASMTAIQLVRSFMKGTQDISISDSVNEMSRPLLRSLGFTVVPIYSLQWARPLRPTQYASQMLTRMKRSLKPFGSVMGLTCRIIDALAETAHLSPYRPNVPATDDEELDTATLLHCVSTIPGKHGLVPQYDQSSIDWIFNFISSRNALGVIRKRLVRNADGKIAGWYVYAVPGKTGIGEVLQIGSQTASAGEVLDHLFYDAWKMGLLALHGRMEPNFMQELTNRSCFSFRHGSWTLVHSSQPELTSLIQSGTAFFSRLDGEGCFRHGGNVIR